MTDAHLPAPPDTPSRLDTVRARIAAACRRAGRSPASVTLVAVSKTRSPDEIVAAVAAGASHLGENRPEEAAEKIPAVNAGVLAAGLTQPVWHMIGHVQGRKAGLVVGEYALVHSLDSLRLGQRLSRLAVAAGTVVNCLVQVNVSGEDTKGGWLVPDPAGTLPDEFLSDLHALQALPGLRLRGLMTIPPAVDDAAQARPYFQHLRRLQGRLRDSHPVSDWCELSMGMTDDFEVAIEEGATLVRVGRAIFGPRTT